MKYNRKVSISLIILQILAIFFIIVALSNCAPATYETRKITKNYQPEWYSKILYPPRVYAILPFYGYDRMSDNIASKIEAKLRSKLVRLNYVVVERNRIKEVLNEHNISHPDLDYSEIGKLLGADVIVVGKILDYYDDTEPLEYVEGAKLSADKVKKYVKITLDFRVIDVASGRILYEAAPEYTTWETCYENLRHINKSYEVSNPNDEFETSLATLRLLADLETDQKINNNKCPTLRKLYESCVNYIVKETSKHLIPYSIIYYKTYKIIGKKQYLVNTEQKFLWLSYSESSRASEPTKVKKEVQVLRLMM